MTARDGTGLPRSGFLILLALADQPRHGLGIVEEVEARADGAVDSGPAPVHDAEAALGGRPRARDNAGA